MKRGFSLLFVLLIVSLLLTAQENEAPYADDISRILLLDFNYFNSPYPLPDGFLTSPDGSRISLAEWNDQVLLMAFLSREDPFDRTVRDSLKELEDHYAGEAFKVVIISDRESDFRDSHSLIRDRLGVLHYPVFFVIDHNLGIRGSAEGVYPDFMSPDFLLVFDKLLLDIKSPGVINTLK